MIIVTGAAGNLGQAVIMRLVQSGSEVIAMDIAPNIPDQGQKISLAGVDLNSADSIAGSLAKIGADIALSGLVNIAGGFRWETLADGSIDSWDIMYRMNVQSCANMCKAALPSLRAAKGSIVNIAAYGAVRAGAGMGAYAASKAGVMRLTEALAAEEMDNNVRVNAVMPSIIDTPLNRSDMPDAEFERWVTPAALADVIAFLLSDASQVITGACIPVTGKVQV